MGIQKNGISLALGGGGAAGLGHIPVLEAFDELGVRPVALAGTSIGALLSAAYSSGLSGVDIREYVLELAANPLQTLMQFWVSHLGDGVNPFKSIDTRSVVEVVTPDRVPATFAELKIPTTAVATDYYGRTQKQFSSGSVRDALAASMSLPGVFAPTRIDGRIYVDGGITNNLPFDALPLGTTIFAVDVSEEPPDDTQTQGEENPGPLDASMEAMRIMMNTILRTRLMLQQPTVIIRPASSQFRVLDFRDVAEVMASAAPAKEETKRALAALLDAP